MDAALEVLSARVGEALEKAGLTLATAESCTGGWVAQVVTHTAGSSAWFERGYVTYSNDAKMDMLGVPAAVLENHGAVSLETAKQMVIGALKYSHADIALAITGIAGPGGGSDQKPVGLVCFAWCRRGEPPHASQQRFSGDREAVRYGAVIHALGGITALLQDDTPSNNAVTL